jgi:hypothetical protein
MLKKIAFTLLQMAYQFEKILGEFPLPDLEGGY